MPQKANTHKPAAVAVVVGRPTDDLRRPGGSVPPYFADDPANGRDADADSGGGGDSGDAQIAQSLSQPKSGAPGQRGNPAADRIAELEARLEGYRPFDALIEDLRSHGVGDADALRAMIADPASAHHALQMAQPDPPPATQQAEALRAELAAHVARGALSPADAHAIWANGVQHLQRESAVRQGLGAVAQHRATAGFDAAAQEYPELRAEPGADALVHVLSAAGHGDPQEVGRMIGQVLRQHGAKALADHLAGRTPLPPEMTAASPWSRLLGA